MPLKSPAILPDLSLFGFPHRRVINCRPMISDSELLRRYADEASQEAFTELVRRHLNVIYAAALRRTAGQTHLAEEVVQEVFTALAQNAARLRDYPTVIGWLFVATRFAASKALRRDRRRQRREQETWQMHSESPAPPRDDADRTFREIRPFLDDLLDSLPDRDRTAVLLRFFEGRSYAELGAALGLTEDAARMRVDRALARLARLLQRRGLASTSALLGSALATHVAIAAPASLATSVAAAACATTTAGASGLFFLTLVSIHKTTTAVAAAGLILLGGFGVYQTLQRRVAEAELASALQQTHALSADLKSAQHANTALAQANAGAQAKLAAASAKTATLASTAPAAPRAAASPPLDPKRRDALFLVRLKAAAQPLFARWHVPPGQQDEAVRLFMEPARIKQDSVQLQKEALRSGHWSEADSARLGERTAEMIQQVQQSLGAIIGPGHFSELMQLANSVPEHEVASHLAGEVWFTDSPLNPPAADALVQILQTNRYSPGRDPTATVGGTALTAAELDTASSLLAQPGIFSLPLITDAAIVQAKDVLAPLQLEALRRLQAQQLASIRIAGASPGDAPH